MFKIDQAPAQFYRKIGNPEHGREIRAIGNPKAATSFELFADVFIKPATVHSKWITTTGTLLIVPLFGAIELVQEDRDAFIHINQVSKLWVKAGTKLQFKNIYPDHSVRFLMLLIKSDTAEPQSTVEYKLDMLNDLQEVHTDRSCSLNLGQFEGREETVYTYQRKDTSVFAYVLQGAFEFQNRLLETGEGLCIWDQNPIELEALSNKAYLALIEF